MAFLELAFQNVLSPAILFFALGALAGLIKSDLEIPDSISRYLSIYLMMAIGFKGGVAIASTPEFNGEVIRTLLAGIGIGFAQPFAAYALLRATSTIDKPTAAAIAAHYGSVSIVTFATAAAFLDANGIIYAGYIVAVLALMEAPAILSGLFIARRGQTAPDVHVQAHAPAPEKLTREILTNGAIVLLLGAFLIDWVTGKPGMAKIEGFVQTPFQGVLCLFLLDMGLLVARNAHQMRHLRAPLVLFCLYMPLTGAAAGLAACRVIGLDAGSGTLFAVLCASASYIAVPAAMRLALPEARAAIYLPMSLAITFPFNIVIGIPLYHAAAVMLLGQP